MNVLIVGHSPGKITPEKSITLKRVGKWMDNAGFSKYDWLNLVNYHAPTLKLSEVSIKPSDVKGYDRIIGLGNLPSQWLHRNEIPHLKVPHPSGLNRIWNDSTVEQRVMEEVSLYLK